MGRRKLTVIVIGAAAVIVLAGGLGILWFMGSSRPSYEPGKIVEASRAGRITLDPAGRMEYGTPRPDGSVPFRLEAEKGIFLEGFARGTGKPVLVIHGGPGYASDGPWEGLSSFEDGYRFFYWHQRGSGRSSKPIDRFASGNYPANVRELEARLGLTAQLADIERLRRAVGAERIDLAGHSFGGLMACLAAVEFPDRIGRLLLVAPAPLIVFPSSSGGLYEEIRLALPGSELPAYEAWLKEFFDYGRLFSRSEKDLEELNAGMIPFYLRAMEARGDPLGDADRTDVSLIGGWMMQACFFSMGRKHDWSKAVARIGCPATMIYGDRDLSDAGSFDQYRAVPGLAVVSAGSGDHFLMHDGPRFASAAKRFFE